MLFHQTYETKVKNGESNNNEEAISIDSWEI